MKQMERNILECVLIQVEISSKKSPDVEDVSAANLELGAVVGIVRRAGVDVFVFEDRRELVGKMRAVYMRKRCRLGSLLHQQTR
jgi:hydrogenase maturation factor HypE